MRQNPEIKSGRNPRVRDIVPRTVDTLPPNGALRLLTGRGLIGVSRRVSDDRSRPSHLFQRSNTTLCVATAPSTSSRTKYTPEAARSPEPVLPSQSTARRP